MTSLGMEAPLGVERVKGDGAPDVATELARLNRRLDVMSSQIGHLYERTLAVEELKNELVPVMREMMGAARQELALIEEEVDSQLMAHLLRQVMRSTPRLIRLLEHLESLESLMDEVQPLGKDAVRAVVDLLQQAEDRGWLRLAQGGVDLFDRLASETSQQDIDRLADNVVTIVDTVKRMTQPEMLELVNQTFGALSPEQEAPKIGLWKMMRAMRDPEVQQGLGVIVEMTRRMARHRAGAVETDESTTTEE